MEKTDFIKVVDPEVAKTLADLGFQYVKEQKYFAFICTDELLSVLQTKFSDLSCFCRENKLRF